MPSPKQTASALKRLLRKCKPIYSSEFHQELVDCPVCGRPSRLNTLTMHIAAMSRTCKLHKAFYVENTKVDATVSRLWLTDDDV